MLEENYRSTKTILKAANDVIKKINSVRIKIYGHQMMKVVK